MNRFISTKTFAAAGLALGALMAATAAQARTDLVLQIGVPAYQVQPSPYYSHPAPYYSHPAPVYYQSAPAYVAPTPYVQYRSYDGRGYDRRHWQRNRFGPNGDLDRDGIANRYDRDRDGDGVPNRWDRDPQNGRRY